MAAILEKGAPDSGEAELQQTNGDDRQVVDEKFSDSEDDVSVTELKLELAPDNEPLPEEAVPVPVEVINTPESLTSIRKRITDRPASSLNALPLVDKQVSYFNQLFITFNTTCVMYFFLYQGNTDTPTQYPLHQLFVSVCLWITKTTRHYWRQFSGWRDEIQLWTLP